MATCSAGNSSKGEKRKVVFFLAIEAFATLVQLSVFWTDTVNQVDVYLKDFDAFLVSLLRGNSTSAFPIIPGALGMFASSEEGRIIVSIVLLSHLVCALISVVWLLNAKQQLSKAGRFFLATSQVLDIVIDCAFLAALYELSLLGRWWYYPTLILSSLSLYASIDMLKTSKYLNFQCTRLYCNCCYSSGVYALPLGHVILLFALVECVVLMCDADWLTDPILEIDGYRSACPILRTANIISAVAICVCLGFVLLSKHRDIKWFKVIVSRSSLALLYTCAIIQLGASFSHLIMGRALAPGLGDHDVLIYATAVVLFVTTLAMYILPWQETDVPGDAGQDESKHGTASEQQVLEEETFNAQSSMDAVKVVHLA